MPQDENSLFYCIWFNMSFFMIITFLILMVYFFCKPQKMINIWFVILFFWVLLGSLLWLGMGFMLICMLLVTYVTKLMQVWFIVYLMSIQFLYMLIGNVFFYLKVMVYSLQLMYMNIVDNLLTVSYLVVESIFNIFFFMESMMYNSFVFMDELWVVVVNLMILPLFWLISFLFDEWFNQDNWMALGNKFLEMFPSLGTSMLASYSLLVLMFSIITSKGFISLVAYFMMYILPGVLYMALSLYKILYSDKYSENMNVQGAIFCFFVGLVFMMICMYLLSYF